MNKRTIWIMAAVVACIAAAGAAVPAGETAYEPATPESVVHHLFGLEVEAAQADTGRPAVILDTDEQVEFETLVLEDPARIVLDLRGVVSHLDEHSFSVNESGVIRVRAGQYQVEPVPVARIVFDLERVVPFEVVRGPGGLEVLLGDTVTRVAEAEPVAEPEPEPEVVIAAALPVAEPEPVIPEPVAEPEPEVIEAEVVQAEPEPETYPDRAMEPDTIEKLLGGGVELAAPTPVPAQTEAMPAPTRPTTSFETQTIVTDAPVYTGKRISLNLVDADLKHVFRLLHDISGLNFVLDPTVEGRVTIVLDHVPWDQALDIILKNNGLDKVLENNVIRIAPTTKLAAEAAQRKQLKEAKELEVEPITITRTLSYAKSKDVERVIRDGGILSPRGKVIVDERTNTLIISDIPKKVEPLDILISTLDTETPQVMIEARIVETSKQFVQDLGVVWGLSAKADASVGTATGLKFPHNASVSYGLNLPGEGGASNLAFKFGNVVDSFTLDIALNTLETEGRGRILSSPKIATQNNELAEIEQGVRIPVVNTTATEINVEFVSASLRLQVTPQITAEGTIILDVTVENNSPDFQNTVGDVPPINTQRAQTKVLIADGGTTVIGGIFTVNEGESEIGVPWFRKIPGLGWLFKSTSVRTENRELLIFITPRIMKIS